ncbi:SDR family oxidoreductase [Akkermansiaceae bacterium]|nr:SDR family oxidoreductase [Akkermansiaceae bacterium]
MSTVLIIGPVSPINKGIVENLLREASRELTWLRIADDKYPGEVDCQSDKLKSLIVNRGEELGSILKSLPKELQFSGIIYAEGIGGVRPAKLNNLDFIQEMFTANVFQFLELVRHCLKQKRLKAGASILTLSSVSSIKGLKSKSVYSASKAALDAAVRGIAAELAPQGVRVNSILKGWVDADMSLDFIESNMKLSSGSDFDRQVLGAISVEEIANLVEFMLSDKIRTITGTNLLIDGGYTL